ncbi:MAG: rhodanese-like domain-containing protein, partial [Pseudomonadota bacterium]
CDLESVVTHFCRVTGLSYNPDWKHILRPLTTLQIERQDLYAFFASTMTRYIPSCPSEHTYQVLRLLLQYHAPDLCSFLETKKISPESYAGQWLSTIFAAAVPRIVLPGIWDVYFQLNDPFLTFFLCLVILINAKEQLLEMSDASKEEIVQTLCSVPAALEVEDVEDFCSLAQHYVSNTPESFRSQFHALLFPTESEKADDMDLTPINSLCLSISVGELLRARSADEQVRYLLVDCRPPDQYNAGHLPTAFHLDSELMLRNPAEFQVSAVRCGAVRCGAVRCCVLRCGVVWCGVIRCGAVRCGAVWCGAVRCDTMRCGVVRCGAVRCCA